MAGVGGKGGCGGFNWWWIIFLILIFCVCIPWWCF